MDIADMILYLRQQLLTLRAAPDRQAAAELLATFKVLIRAAYEQGDRDLMAVLVDLADSTRDLYMGRPLNGKLPAEAQIRAAAVQMQRTVATPSVEVPIVPPSDALDETQPIDADAIAAALEADNDTSADDIPDRESLLRALASVSERDWQDHTHLRDGSPRQMRAYSTVYDHLAIFHTLRQHYPLWAGTFPIDVDVPTSDIDIICNPSSLRQFITDARAAYGEQDGFKLIWKAVKQTPTVIVRFVCNTFPVELFAQPTSVRQQDAYQHMVVEAQLLAIGGEQARDNVRRLKADGLKTEPAFSAVFELKSENPYQHLLQLANMDNEALLDALGY